MEVTFEPYKKITFQSHLEYKNADEFAQAIASSVTGGPGMQFLTRLFWANGILFRFFNHPPSEAQAKELFNGHLILDHIEFAPMPTFSKSIKIHENPDVTISVFDVSKHVVLNPLTAWIRDNLVTK